MTSSVKQEPTESKNGSQASASTAKRTKSYESRKIRKPLMEKKRRARINESLNQLKQILLEANGAPTKKEGNRPFKLEKADILEGILKHLQSMNTSPTSSPATNNSNKSSVTSTSTSESDEETSSSIISGQAKLSPKGTLSPVSSPLPEGHHNHNHDHTSHHHPNNNIETPFVQGNFNFISGFAECIRLVQASMKSQIPSKALEDKLKSHLAELHQSQISVSENNKPLGEEVRHLHDCRASPMTMAMDDQDEIMTLKCPPDSPASFSQMSPGLLTNKGHCNSSGCEGSSRAILIPTRMSSGELAFVLKYPDNNAMAGGGFGCFDIDIPLDHSFGRVIKSGRTFSGYSHNHMDIDNQPGVWRPW